jgi:PKD domain
MITPGLAIWPTTVTGPPVVANFTVAAVNGNISTFFGEDLNNSESIPLQLYPNSNASHQQFISIINAPLQYTFESNVPGLVPPVTFGSGPSAVQCFFSSGVVVNRPINTAVEGRYSVPSASSTKFLELLIRAGTTPQEVEIQFSSFLTAFGFYGVDIGDFGGRMVVDLLTRVFDANTGLFVDQVVGTFPVPHSVGTNASTGGSVCFFGLATSNSSLSFYKVRFKFTPSTTNVDVFAFDNFTISRLANLTSTVGSAPLTVSFTDTSTNQPTQWQWDFENNGSVDSTQQSPTHTYTQPGVYSPSLTVTRGISSNTIVRSNLIVVT